MIGLSKSRSPKPTARSIERLGERCTPSVISLLRNLSAMAGLRTLEISRAAPGGGSSEFIAAGLPMGRPAGGAGYRGGRRFRGGRAGKLLPHLGRGSSRDMDHLHDPAGWEAPRGEVGVLRDL